MTLKHYNYCVPKSYEEWLSIHKIVDSIKDLESSYSYVEYVQMGIGEYYDYPKILFHGYTSHYEVAAYRGTKGVQISVSDFLSGLGVDIKPMKSLNKFELSI